MEQNHANSNLEPKRPKTQLPIDTWSQMSKCRSKLGPNILKEWQRGGVADSDFPIHSPL